LWEGTDEVLGVWSVNRKLSGFRGGIRPSMRRPVSVKAFLSSFLFFSFSASFISSFPKLFPFSQAASVATLPSALFVERLSLGARWVYLFQ
jgi:hypothetical protein